MLVYRAPHTVPGNSNAIQHEGRIGPSHPSSCQVSGEGLSSAVAHRAANFAIYAQDSNGRRRREGGEPFVVSIRGPGAVTTSVRDCQDGTYSCGWVATVSGCVLYLMAA